MAKDGINRGGRRVRAGDKPFSLADKIAAGKSANVLDILEFEIDEQFDLNDFSEMSELQGENIPKPSEYFKSQQKDGNLRRNLDMVERATM